MLKKIITYIFFILLTVLFSAYFYFASILRTKGAANEICRSIRVTILDSNVNRFVSKEEVIGILNNSHLPPIGRRIDSLNLNSIEELLNRRSAIKKSDVSIDREGLLNVFVTQRRPVLRIETPQGGFYVDDSQYVFPLVHTFTSYVPIVSGNIPINLHQGYRGTVDQEDRKWMTQIIKFGEFIDQNEFWRAQIQQIYISNNKDILLFTRVGNQVINFGSFDDIEYKFAKLDSFYNNVAPIYGWNKYSVINLKYSNQIVCTKEKNNKKIKYE